MDTNGDLGIMSHVGHLQRTLEFVTGKWMETMFFLGIGKFRKMSRMSRQMSHLWHFQWGKWIMDHGTVRLGLTLMHMWHVSYSGVTWFILLCDMTHTYVWHDYIVHAWHDSRSCVTWFTFMCDTTHLAKVELDLTDPLRRNVHLICHVTHMNESCRTYKWVISHIWISHVTHMKVSCHTYEWESCHTYEWVMSHIWMNLCELWMEMSNMTYTSLVTHRYS